MAFEEQENCSVKADKNRKVILVTGASSGLGNALAVTFATNGYQVFGTSRQSRDSTVDGVTMLKMDVNDDASVRGVIQDILLHAGKIDVIINNAGIGIAGAIEDTSVEEAREQFETNFFGVHRVCQQVIPLFRSQGYGHIINIGSLGGVVAIPFQAFYSASKSALASFSDGLSMELAPFGTKVTRIEPGDYKTGFTAARTMVSGSGEGSIYFDRCRRAIKVMENDEQNGADVMELSKKVLKIVEMKRPRLVYREGKWLQTFLVRLMGFLPNRWVEGILIKVYGG